MRNNIRKFRKEKNYTLKYVTEKLSMAESTLSKIENGQQNLYADTAVQLAELFNVSVDELLGREWDNPKDTIIKTVDFELPDILHKLNTFTDNQLLKLSGVIDFILENREKYTPQQIKNTLDKVSEN